MKTLRLISVVTAWLVVGCGSELATPGEQIADASSDDAAAHDDAHDMDEGTVEDAAASSDAPTAADSATAEDTGGVPVVHVGSYYYRPAALTVAVGTKVRFVWDSGTHTVTSGTACTSDGKFDSGRKSSGSWEYTFTTAGTFPYFCDYMTHCTVRRQIGTVTVTP